MHVIDLHSSECWDWSVTAVPGEDPVQCYACHALPIYKASSHLLDCLLTSSSTWALVKLNDVRRTRCSFVYGFPHYFCSVWGNTSSLIISQANSSFNIPLSCHLLSKSFRNAPAGIPLPFSWRYLIIGVHHVSLIFKLFMFLPSLSCWTTNSLNVITLYGSSLNPSLRFTQGRILYKVCAIEIYK